MMAEEVRKLTNASWPQLHPDAARVPLWRQPRPGVEYGCGLAGCRLCYQPLAVPGAVPGPGPAGGSDGCP